VITNPSFATDIYTTMIVPSCINAACHDSASPAANLDLSSLGTAYLQLVDVAPTDLACTVTFRVDGTGSDPTNSLLVTLLESSCGVSSQMPKGQGPIHANQIQTIKNWINQGASNS
jgi:hypothetical protein